MMRYGLHTALEEITLVLFTTLAPSGAFALIIMALVLLVGRFDDACRRRLNQFFCVPLVISMVGLVASATHLGNPANALYVFLGVGRSPLSTEVFCAVIFLAFSGVYWLYSFAQKPKLALQKVWLVLIVLAGAAFITSIGFAYSYETIISWDTVYAPVSLWLNALVGGPIVALLTLQLALKEKLKLRLRVFLVGLSGVALVGNVVVYFLQNSELSTIENSVTSAAELVPFYPVLIVVFAVFSAIALVVHFLFARKNQLPPLWLSITSCVFVCVGIFIMRFAFYMMHMTVGLTV